MKNLSRKEMKEIQGGSGACEAYTECFYNNTLYPFYNVCCDGIDGATTWCQDNGYGPGPHYCWLNP